MIKSKASLAVALSKLKTYSKPSISLEQYPTDSEIAAEILWSAYMHGDLSGKTVADLGSGTGILGIGALYLGASKVFFVEKDSKAMAIAKENIEDQLSLICRCKRLYHTHFNDNDQQCDADVPPGVVNPVRLVSMLYVLDQMNYDGWFGLDLFPYRDDPKRFIEVSRDNLRYAGRVVDMMNKKGARELRASGIHGPEMAELIRECMRNS